MPPVVNLHRRCVDGRFQGVGRVREGRKRVCHDVLLIGQWDGLFGGEPPPTEATERSRITAAGVPQTARRRRLRWEGNVCTRRATATVGGRRGTITGSGLPGRFSSGVLLAA